MARARRRRPSPFVLAGAVARAATRAVVDVAGEVTEDVAAATGRALVRRAERTVATVGSLGQRVAAGEVGIGPVRVRPQDVEWVRQQVVAGVRSLLAVPDDTADRLRTADPTTMARAVLSLVGGDEALVPLPTPEEQIRQRFRDLLDPTDTGRDGLSPALLTITAQLSPDEARMVRHLAVHGPHPVAAVESTTLTGRRGPTVARHLTVLVARSGGDHPERASQYVENLVRLGVCDVDEAAEVDEAAVSLIEGTGPYEAAVARIRADGRRPRVRPGVLRLTALGGELVGVALAGTWAAGPSPVEPPPPPGAALRAPDRVPGR